MEKQTITNATTNEQFSVVTEEDKEVAGIFTVKIKRDVKKRQNGWIWKSKVIKDRKSFLIDTQSFFKICLV